MPPELSEFPEFEEPRRVDDIVLGPDGLPTDRAPILAGRGHLGVLEGSPRQGYDLVEYARSPWALVRTLVKELFAASWGSPTDHNAENSYRVDIEDEGGILQTLSGRADSNGTDTVFNRFVQGTPTVALRYGSDGTAPTQNDNSLGTPEGGDIDSLDVTWDSVNERLTTSGSRIHTEAGVTAREIGEFLRWADIDGNFSMFLVDRAVLAQAVQISTDQTVTMTFETQM